MELTIEKKTKTKKSAPAISREQVLEDYRTCCMSRECSVLARKEVLTGKAKFGIIGDGKELPQVAMARFFKKGDWRSGYYRDQTFHFAAGLMTVESFFAQLYADPENDLFSKGRSMNCHFVTPTVDANGEWLEAKNLKNSSADISPTAGQMARGLGLAFASKKYRRSPELRTGTVFSENGDEICFVTIGDASTSEGVFWESLNAAGVLQVPMITSVWDDGYGISVPKRFQTSKSSISKALEGFQFEEGLRGIDIHRVRAWDYPALLETYEKAAEKARKSHIPALVHVEEVTQQLGHSTSGDHRRYKNEARLKFEVEFDCNSRFAAWIVESGFSTAEELEKIKSEAIAEARAGQKRAYENSLLRAKKGENELCQIFEKLENELPETAQKAAELRNLRNPQLFELAKLARQTLHFLTKKSAAAKTDLEKWLADLNAEQRKIYSSDLYSSTPKSALKVKSVPAIYAENAASLNGFEILNAFFDKKLAENPAIHAFGEDVGEIGDVNQGFAGLQKKHGKERVFDVGIREWTIMGQAIGMAMRGLRPIAEIQYLDYLLYGISPLSDDLAMLRWRTAAQQAAPAIIRTRGHRLEGVWHTGSPMSMMLGTLRGMWICVPRDMTRAAGFYNTLLKSDDPAIVVECLNGYRLKEKMPENLDDFCLPLGQVEILREGSDATLVTYGSCVRVAEDACDQLLAAGISVELIDAQTLLPFDLDKTILRSLQKTSRIAFLDEDFVGGATAFMLQKVIDADGGYRFLDAKPRTITAQEHRGPYGSDGDYWTKPSAEDVFEAIFEMVAE